MPRLVAQSPEFAGQSFDLTGPEITVGRIADNKIQLEHASVSGHHGILRLDGLDYFIKDLDSTNGTRVNGERVSEQKLRRNDIVRLGNIELLYDSEHQPPGQPMPTLSERVKLSECQTQGRPPGFINASPLSKKQKNAANKQWTFALTIVGILAVCSMAYFVWVVFLTDHSSFGS